MEHDVTPTSERARDLCRRHHLDLVELWSGPTGGSRLVALVRDPQHTPWVLKQVHPRFATELTALRAWQATGLAARIIAALEPGVLSR